MLDANGYEILSKYYGWKDKDDEPLNRQEMSERTYNDKNQLFWKWNIKDKINFILSISMPAMKDRYIYELQDMMSNDYPQYYQKQVISPSFKPRIKHYQWLSWSLMDDFKLPPTNKFHIINDNIWWKGIWYNITKSNMDKHRHFHWYFRYSFDTCNFPAQIKRIISHDMMALDTHFLSQIAQYCDRPLSKFYKSWALDWELRSLDQYWWSHK